MDSKNKLVRAISAEELQAFLDELTRTPGVDGPMIQRLAEEKFGVEIGHNSANHFRSEVFQKYLARLSSRKQLAKAISENGDDKSGRTLADAASDELQQSVFEFLTEREKGLDLSDDDDLDRAEKLSRIIKSARSEDRKMIKDLEARIEATKQVVENKALSAEQQRERLREILK